jgi:hypothetical protein
VLALAVHQGPSDVSARIYFFLDFESWRDVRLMELDAKMNLRDEINPPVMRTVPCCLSNDQWQLVFLQKLESSR